MKKLLALILTCILLFSGCTGTGGDGQAAQPTPEVTAEPTPSPTPAPVYVNPLNGEILDEPYTGRIIACTISNKKDAIPHVGVNEADIYMEMFVNNSIIRGLALYTNIQDVDAIGGVRSNRLMFNDIVTHYDAITVHSGGSNQVLNATHNAGIDNINIDMWVVSSTGASYRDKDHGRPYENTLFAIGSGVVGYAESQNMRITQDADKDYKLDFADDGTPKGETASEISVTFSYNGSKKETLMKYDAAADKYVYHQYDTKMSDLLTGEDEAFTNVIIMNTSISMNGIYQVADFVAGGDGWYANGGQIIPILWHCDAEDEPFYFTTADGAPLELGRGNTYVAIAPIGSPVDWA